MLSYSSQLVKLIDWSNSYDRSSKAGNLGTFEYAPPELRNVGLGSDVFAFGLVTVELASKQFLLPDDLSNAFRYCGQDGHRLRQHRCAELYRLVLISSMVNGRPVWNGRLIRKYGGGPSLRAKVRSLVLESFPDAEIQVQMMSVRVNRVRSKDGVFWLTGLIHSVVFDTLRLSIDT